MQAFIDIGRSKPHVVFCPETGQTFPVGSLTELLNKDFIAAYVETLFPNILGAILGLISSGVRVYHLRQLSLVSLLRQKQGLEKNDENDAKVLASLPTEEFSELTEQEIRLRILINEYYQSAGTIKHLKLKSTATPNNVLDDAQKLLLRQRKKLAKKILAKAETCLPHYQLLKERLGLNGVSLVSLLVYVDFSQGFDKVVRQAGRTAHHGKTRRRSRKAIRAINSLATLCFRHRKKRYFDVYQYYFDILKSKRKALLRVQTWMLKDIHHIVTGRPLREPPNLS